VLKVSGNPGRGFGTAFTIDIGEKQYVVSAKHIFVEENGLYVARINPNTNEEIWMTPNHEQPLYTGDTNIDVIVFPLNQPITPSHKLPVTTEHGLGHDVYFLGFPFGWKTSGGNVSEINNGFPFPFVKKGIISEFRSRGSSLPMGIYIDAHNNEGFSGGPVIFPDKDKNMQVVGIISGYLPELVNVSGPMASGGEWSVNSGIAHASPVSFALGLIQKYERLK